MEYVVEPFTIVAVSMAVVPSKNVTVPVGVKWVEMVGVTVAVNVTVSP